MGRVKIWLNVFAIRIPSLRKRREDIPHLVEVFLNQLNDRYGKQISAVYPAVTEAFRRYDWPGNIRELETVLERAYILEMENRSMPARFPGDLMGTEELVAVRIPDAGMPLAQARQREVESFKQETIRKLLKRNAKPTNPSAAEAEITPV